MGAPKAVVWILYFSSELAVFTALKGSTKTQQLCPNVKFSLSFKRSSERCLASCTNLHAGLFMTSLAKRPECEKCFSGFCDLVSRQMEEMVGKRHLMKMEV